MLNADASRGCFQSSHFNNHHQRNITMLRNKLLAAAVVSAFASPMVAIAEDAKPAPGPAIPTMSQILDSSGITMSGYIDTAYSHANKDIEAGPSGRVFDAQNNSFVLHQVGLTIAKQPKEGFGGVVNVTAGKDAEVINAADGTGSSTFNLTQAFAQYATGNLTVIAGKYTTLQGTEVIASPSDVNFSRSLLFFGEPVTHTGIRGTYAVNDKISLIAGVNNGIVSSAKDTNKGKTLELGAVLTPIKPLSIGIYDLNGKEDIGGGLSDTRNSFNIVASYTVIDPLTIGLEYLRVSQKELGASSQKYTGEALYVTYMITPKWRIALRGEMLKDADGLLFATPASADNKYKEGTVTLSFLPSDSFEVRGEVRTDHATNDFYLDSSTGVTSKSLTTYALQGIYKF
jgi:hypothetical protein